MCQSLRELTSEGGHDPIGIPVCPHYTVYTVRISMNDKKIFHDCENARERTSRLGMFVLLSCPF